MSSIVRGRSRAILKMMQVVVPLAAAAVALPHSASAQGALRSLPAGAPEPVHVQLAERGWPDGLQLRGHYDRRTVHLPILRALGPTSGRLLLDLEASLPGYRVASLEVRLNGRSAAAVDLLQQPGGRLEMALAASDLDQPFITVDAIFRGSVADDLCTDERLAGGFVTLRPSSGLVLATSPAAQPDIWRTIEALPNRVTIGFAGDPGEPRLLAAALQTAAALTRAGHEIVFLTPDRSGDLHPVGLAARQEQFDTADVVIGEPATVHDALARGLGDTAERLLPIGFEAADVALGLASVARRDGGATLAVTPDAATGLGTLMANGMASLAAGGTATVTPALDGSRTAPAVVRLDQLAADLSPRSLVDATEWRFSVPVTRLPVGQVARAAVLDLMVPAGPDGEPMLATAIVDGEVAGWWRFVPGPEPVRLQVDLAPNGTRLIGDVRLRLQRQATTSACRSQPMPVEADLLSTSHLQLAALDARPGSFAEFAALAGGTVEILVDQATMRRPAALLETLAPIASQLFRPGSAFVVRVADRLEAAAGTGARLLVGRSFAAGLEAALPVGRPGLRVASTDGTSLVEIDPAEPLAILQLARHGQQSVLWLAASDGELPPWRPRALDRETVLIGSAAGTRLGFDAASDRAIRIDHASADGWRAWLGAGWLPVLAIGWLALTLAAVQLARWRRGRLAGD